MKILFSSKTLSSSPAALESAIDGNDSLAVLDFFWGFGGIDKAVSEVAECCDYDQVIYYFKEAIKKDDNRRETTSAKSLTDIFNDIFGNTEHSRTTDEAYNHRDGEHWQYSYDEQGLQHRSHGYSEAHSDACRGLRPRRGATRVRGNGEGDGLRTLVGLGGEVPRDEVLQGGTHARATRNARDGGGEAPCQRAQREYHAAAGTHRHRAALWRRRHRPGEHHGKRCQFVVFKSVEHLKAA